MSEERPTKIRKSKRGDTVSKPEVVVEMAEPVETPEIEEDGKLRKRQLTSTDVPFEFLPANVKEELIRRQELEEQERIVSELRNAQNTKKAKTLLGIFIGAGIGMYVAYLVKDKLFSPAMEAAIESASSIVEDTTQ